MRYLTLLLTVGTFIATTDNGAAQDAARAYAQQSQISFIGVAERRPEWEFYGSNAEAFVKFEPKGLRITVPAGFKGQRPPYHGTRPVTGLAIGLVVKGDFEITTSYEFLQDPEPPGAGPEATRFTLDAVLDGPLQNVAVLSRRAANPAGNQFNAWMKIWNQAQGKYNYPSQPFPAQAKSGRLRMVRTGADLSSFASEGEGGDFKLLQTRPFAIDDVVDVRLVASTGDEKAALDVRVTDLSIRAASIEKRTKPLAIPSAPAAVIKPPPAKEYAQEYSLPFKGGSGKSPGWQPHGPGAEECVFWEPEGLRLSLPTGWGGERPSTGIKSVFGVKGDFELTCNFEMLKEHLPKEAGKFSTRLTLEIFKEGPQPSIATVSRSLNAQGSIFVAWSRVPSKEAEKPKVTASVFPTDAKTGRLRLVRSGADLYFGMANGFDGEFQYRAKHLFGDEDLSDVRIMGSTGGEMATLDARVTDLRLRADAIPNMPSGPIAVAPGTENRPAAASPIEGRGRLLGGAVALLLALGLGAWLFFGRRRRVAIGAAEQRPVGTAVEAALVSMPCACGKKLKVKAELAGKKVKCPQCGTALLVPK